MVTDRQGLDVLETDEEVFKCHWTPAKVGSGSAARCARGARPPGSSRCCCCCCCCCCPGAQQGSLARPGPAIHQRPSTLLGRANTTPSPPAPAASAAGRTRLPYPRLPYGPQVRYHSIMGASAAILEAGFSLDCLMIRYQGIDWTDYANWKCNGRCGPGHGRARRERRPLLALASCRARPAARDLSLLGAASASHQLAPAPSPTPSTCPFPPFPAFLKGGPAGARQV